MSAKLHDFFTRFRRGTYAPINSDGSNEEAGGGEKRTSIGGKSRFFMKPILQCVLVLALMLISYLFGTYSTTFGTQSTGFIPTVPIKPGANVFSEDHAWVGPGKESDILWAELYQITSDDKFIQIGDPERYGIPPGQQDNNGINFYSISVYHQLHCLAMFRALVYDDSLSQNDGDHKRGLVHGLSQNKTWEDWYHIGHCFNYVRLAIRCTVDTTLEWPPGKIKPKKDMATSKGNRQCRDISFLDDFVEENKWINPTD